MARDLNSFSELPTTDSRSPSIGCLILAAGGSRRLGRPKQLVKLNKSTLLERTIVAALGVPALWPVVIVVGADNHATRAICVKFPVLIAKNSTWTEGIASSLRSGISILEQYSPAIDAVLITLCDQPALSSAVFESLLSALHQTQRPAAASRYSEHLGPPVILSRSHFEAISKLTGDEGARKIIRALPQAKLAVVDHPDLAWDIDHPEDLARILPKPD
jgi:molybdenum cofactor cytidylyltransferase